MRVTIDDGVYKLAIQVKIESVFDNRKGPMIQRTDIFQFVWVCGGIWWGSKTSK